MNQSFLNQNWVEPRRPRLEVLRSRMTGLQVVGLVGSNQVEGAGGEQDPGMICEETMGRARNISQGGGMYMALEK